MAAPRYRNRFALGQVCPRDRASEHQCRAPDWSYLVHSRFLMFGGIPARLGRSQAIAKLHRPGPQRRRRKAAISTSIEFNSFAGCAERCDLFPIAGQEAVVAGQRYGRGPALSQCHHLAVVELDMDQGLGAQCLG